MSTEFLIWRYQSVAGACIPNRLEGMTKKFQLHTGVPRRADFPANVTFHMNPDFPNDLVVLDNIRNGALAVLVSEGVHKFLQLHAGPCVEYLPVKIVDNKGHVASASHVIVHPIEPLDCIDRQQSIFTPSALIEGNIDRFAKLVIDASLVPADRQLFKLKGHGEPIIARRAFAESLRQQMFSGLDWLEVAAYRGR